MTPLTYSEGDGSVSPRSQAIHESKELSLGLALRELSNAELRRAPRPLVRYKVAISKVASWSLAAKQDLRPGVLLLRINGQSLEGKGRLEALRMLQGVGPGPRTLAFHPCV